MPYLALGLGAVAVIATVAGMMLVAISPSPEDAIFNVTLTNDLRERVIIEAPCDLEAPKCDFKVVAAIEPGSSVQITTVVGNDLHYRVIGASNQLLGCIPLMFSTPSPGATAFLSQQLAPC